MGAGASTGTGADTAITTRTAGRQVGPRGCPSCRATRACGGGGASTGEAVAARPPSAGPCAAQHAPGTWLHHRSARLRCVERSLPDMVINANRPVGGLEGAPCLVVALSQLGAVDPGPRPDHAVYWLP